MTGVQQTNVAPVLTNPWEPAMTGSERPSSKSPPLPSPRERNTESGESESPYSLRFKCGCNRVLASDMKSMVMHALASIVVVCERIKRTKFRERRREITIAPSGRGSVFPVHPTPNVTASSRGSDLIKSRTATQEPNYQMGVTTRD
jgi:hypothetical protein